MTRRFFLALSALFTRATCTPCECHPLRWQWGRTPRGAVDRRGARSAVCGVRNSALAEELEALGPVALRQHLVHRDPTLAARGLVLSEVTLVDALPHDLAAAG